MKWINKYIEAERRAEACLPMQPKIIKKRFNYLDLNIDRQIYNLIKNEIKDIIRSSRAT